MNGIHDMGGIIGDEIAGQAGDVFGTGGAALQFQPTLDQLARPRADHVARQMQRDRG